MTHDPMAPSPRTGTTAPGSSVWRQDTRGNTPQGVVGIINSGKDGSAGAEGEK
jgi:hypothetical protein